MFQQGTFDAINEEKAWLKTQIEYQRRIIGEFDAQCIANESSEREESAESTEFRLFEMQQDLDILKEGLNALRLQGGEFEVYHKKQRKVLEVTKEGQFILCNIKYSLKPEIPEDMSSHTYFRIGIAKPNDPVVLENYMPAGQDMYISRFAEHIFYIENLHSVRLLTDRSGIKSVAFEWKEPRNSTVTVVLGCNEAEELEEVVGVLLKRFNQQKVKQVRKLQELWQKKEVKYDSNNPEHESKLLRLWDYCFPDIALEDRITPQWGKLGFQGKDPATDFRGMGILGLDCLLYMAQHYNEKMKLILSLKREYPFASAGINMTAILLTEFLGLKPSLMKQSASSISWNSPLLTFFCYCDSDTAFEEVFCSMMLMLDAVFADMEAGYMQFPAAMERVKKHLHDLLARRPLSLNQLHTWIQQRILIM